MAIDARLIQQNLNTALQNIRPAENLLTGFQAGQGLVQNQQNLLRGDLQNQALQQQVQQQAELAPLEQEVRGAQLQEILSSIGAPDVPTAKEIAFNTSKLAQLPDAQVPSQINRMISNAQLAGRTTENLDELLSVYQQDPVRGRELLNAGVQAFQQTGLLETEAGRGGLASAKTEIFDNGTVINSLPDGTTQVSDPSGNLVTGDERVEVLKTARQEEIGFAGKKAAATEEAKLSTQSKLLPSIRSAIKAAEKQAVEGGDIETSLNASKAALPGLTQVVTRLKSLADDATFTMTGKVFNTIAKEFGFSTKGDTSRARMVSIVDNQVLPLLKPIFGAAFTAIEGDRLRNAFLDPDSSPDSRRASLDSFLEQMERNISTKEEELRLRGDGQGGGDAGIIKVDANGNRARVFADGTFEEL